MSADGRARNFILIDHSIAAEGGHYLEYARHVLAAAEQMGYCPVLVTNRAFHALVGPPYEVHRLYERDIWGRSLERSRRRIPPRLDARLRNRTHLPDRLGSILRVGPALIGELIRHERHVRAFARDTRQLLTRLRPGRADVVFIPTLSEADLIGLARCLRDPASELPTWHLLFRREIYSGHEPSYDLDSDLIRRIRRYLLRRTLLHIVARFPSHGVHLYTDTERLTDQYDRLGATKFSTLPIPVNPEFRPPSRTRRGHPLLVTYLGDARSEKGYHLLPPLIESLRPELEAGTIRFAVQSNLPFAHPLILEARERLRRFPPRFVSLYEQPLDSSAYAEFVLNSDIVVLLYDAEHYYARSSGVLVEALSAGVPVVVPASSWMSDVLQPETTKYHEELLAGGAREIEPERNWQTESGQPVEDPGSDLILGHGAQASCSYLRPRPSDKHLLVQVTFVRKPPVGAYLHVAALFVDQRGHALSSDERLLAATIGLTTSALFAVPSQTKRVVLSLGSAPGPGPILLVHPRVHLLDAHNPVSLEALGRTYVSPEQTPGAIREMVNAIEIYRAHAAEFSTRRRLSDSAALLVSHLTALQAEATHRVAERSRAPTMP